MAKIVRASTVRVFVALLSAMMAVFLPFALIRPGSALEVIGYGMIFALPFALIIALPAVLAWNSIDQLTLPKVASLATGLVALPVFVIFIDDLFEQGLQLFSFLLLVTFLLLGAFSSLVFWTVVGGWRNTTGSPEATRAGE